MKNGTLHHFIESYQTDGRSRKINKRKSIRLGRRQANKAILNDEDK
jgi:hypothetical protein